MHAEQSGARSMLGLQPLVAGCLQLNTAMHLATVISNPVVRSMPFSVGDCPTVIRRRKRSLVSITRRHVIVLGSMSSLTNLSNDN